MTDESNDTWGGKHLPAPEPTGELLPYEQTALRALVNQFVAASPRVRTAFLFEVTPPALTAGRPIAMRTSGRVGAKALSRWRNA